MDSEEPFNGSIWDEILVCLKFWLILRRRRIGQFEAKLEIFIAHGEVSNWSIWDETGFK